MCLTDEKARMGTLVCTEDKSIVFCDLIVEIMGFFGLSQTAIPDGSLPGYWNSMARHVVLEFLAYGHM